MLDSAGSTLVEWGRQQQQQQHDGDHEGNVLPYICFSACPVFDGCGDYGGSGGGDNDEDYGGDDDDDDGDRGDDESDVLSYTCFSACPVFGTFCVRSFITHINMLIFTAFCANINVLFVMILRASCLSHMYLSMLLRSGAINEVLEGSVLFLWRYLLRYLL